MLHLPSLLAIVALFTVIFASPRPHPAPANDAIVTITETSTAIITATAPESTDVTTPPPHGSTSTSSNDASLTPSSTWPVSTSTTYLAPQTVPTSWFSVSAARFGSEIHLLPINAAGLRFYLGGNTVSYCPDSVMNSTIGCPPGTTTVISLCNMVSSYCQHKRRQD
jgi:hypothetical protein